MANEFRNLILVLISKELQYWIGLANPNSVICTNDECNGQMVWGNANGSLFHYETYHTQSTISDDGNPCMRVYFGPNYDDPSIDASGDFNDLGCDIILPFVCEMECYQ